MSKMDVFVNVLARGKYCSSGTHLDFMLPFVFMFILS